MQTFVNLVVEVQNFIFQFTTKIIEISQIFILLNSNESAAKIDIVTKVKILDKAL